MHGTAAYAELIAQLFPTKSGQPSNSGKRRWHGKMLFNERV
jgi:hypothetical protein